MYKVTRVDDDIICIHGTILGFMATTHNYTYMDIKQWKKFTVIAPHKNPRKLLDESSRMTDDGIRWAKENYLPKLKDNHV